VKVAAYGPLDLGHVALGNPAQCRQQVENGVIDKPVVDELSISPVGHQTGTPHVLKDA